mgnify:CR=1 FL=1
MKVDDEFCDKLLTLGKTLKEPYNHSLVGQIKQESLYDLEKDPSEMNNRYGDPEYKEIQENLHLRLSELRKQYGDSDSLDQMHIDRYLSTIQN